MGKVGMSHIAGGKEGDQKEDFSSSSHFHPLQHRTHINWTLGTDGRVNVTLLSDKHKSAQVSTIHF